MLEFAQEFDLGAGRFVGAFANEEDRRTAWELNRRGLVGMFGPGYRPQAWWEYDTAGVDQPDFPDEPATLWRMGQLEGAELVTVENRWRSALETVGRDADDPARAAVLVLHGIPEDWAAAQRGGDT